MINPSSQPLGFDPSEAPGVHFSVDFQEQPVSAGMLLRHARESAGLHIAALAVALKVPVKKLEALEMDRHDLLPDTVFVRALASSVCRTLKIDATPVLALLPQAVVPSYRQAPVSAQSSFSAYPSSARPLNLASVSGPALMAGLLLVAGAAVLVFLPAIKDAVASVNARGLNGDSVLGAVTGLRIGLSAGDGSSESTFAPMSAVPGVANASVPPVDNDASRDAVANSLTALSLSPLPTVASVALAPMAAVNGLRPAAEAVSPTVPLIAADSSGPDRLVTFSAATQSSWVKVTDAKGAVVLSRTIAPGEAVFAAGALPLSVVVGRADATRVQVRGQAFDLAAYSRENIARFEVK